jgi:transposase InsO family protein
MGPFPASKSGKRYALLITDGYSRYTCIFFLKHKSDADAAIQAYLKDTEILLSQQVRIFRCDNGGEFINEEIICFFESKGIRLETSTPYTPAKNGLAERRNCTILHMTRSILYASQLDVEYWAEAMATATYLTNSAPTKALDGLTPYEHWTKQSMT